MTSKPSSSRTAAILVFVCAAAAAVGMMTHSWATASHGGSTAYVGLLGGQTCDGSTCVATDWGPGGTGSIEVLGYLAFVGALGAIGCCVAIGAMVLSRHTVKIPVATMHAILGAGLGVGAVFLGRVLTYGDDNELWPSWSAFLALGGIGGAIILFQAMIVPAIHAERGDGRVPRFDMRKLGALGVLLSISGLVVALFLWMVGPAAAREVQAACNGMGPTWSNPAFKHLPAPAPDFELQDTKGNTVKLSELQGRVVLVNFWASWCDVCKSEKKSLARITNDLAGDDFVVLSVASDSDTDAVDHSLKIALGGPEQASQRAYGGAPFRILMDPPNNNSNLGDTAHAWGIEKVPESFLIDRKGQIRMYLVNKRDWSADVVETCVQSLIDE